MRSYNHYVRELWPEGGYYVCPDDKDKKMVWKVPSSQFGLNLVTYVWNSPHWSFIEMSPEEANLCIQNTIRQHVPERLRRLLKVDLDVWRLPHLYNTVKSKCFNDSAWPYMKTCTRRGHSCCRNCKFCVLACKTQLAVGVESLRDIDETIWKHV